MMRLSIALCLFAFISSCSQENPYDDVFILDVYPRTAPVVPTATRSCVDIYTGEIDTKSISSSSVKFTSFGIAWKDSTRDLFIVKIQLDASASALATKVDITDTDEIGTLFGVGDRSDVKIPRMGDTAGGAVANENNLYRTDLKDFDNDGEMDDGQAACGLAFGGFSLPEQTTATVGALLKVTAIAQDSSGNQEVITVSTPVSLLITND